MATPKVVTDGVTPFAEGHMNKFLAADAGKLQVKVNYARVRYTGSVWEVVTSVDSCALVSANLAFASSILTVALTGYTVAPLALVSPSVGAGVYIPKALAASASAVQISFYDIATGALISAVSANMDCQVLTIGV
jgi:hypothetical protein